MVDDIIDTIKDPKKVVEGAAKAAAKAVSTTVKGTKQVIKDTGIAITQTVKTTTDDIKDKKYGKAVLDISNAPINTVQNFTTTKTGGAISETITGRNTATDYVLNANPEKVEEIVEKLEKIYMNIVVKGNEEVRAAVKSLNNTNGVARYGYQVSDGMFNKDFEDIANVVKEIEKDIKGALEKAQTYSNSNSGMRVLSTIGVLGTSFVDGYAGAIEDVGDAYLNGVGVIGSGVISIFGNKDAAKKWKDFWGKPSKTNSVHEWHKKYIYGVFDKNADITSDSFIARFIRGMGGASGVVTAVATVEGVAAGTTAIDPTGGIATSAIKKGVYGTIVIGAVDSVINPKDQPQDGKIYSPTIKPDGDATVQDIKVAQTHDYPDGDIRKGQKWTDLIPDDMKETTPTPKPKPGPSGGGYDGGYSDPTNPQPKPEIPTETPTEIPTERPTEAITQPITEAPTVPQTSAPNNGGSNNGYSNGGGYYSENNNYSNNETPTEVQTTAPIDEDVIKPGNTYKLPTSTKPATTTTTTSSGGSSVIPVLAGLGAAAAAGIGAKAYIDRKNNRDNDEEAEEFKAEDWSADENINVEYQEPIENEEQTLDFDDTPEVEEPEKYGARTHQELENLQ